MMAMMIINGTLVDGFALFDLDGLNSPCVTHQNRSWFILAKVMGQTCQLV
jgi:hypothetical protein